MFVFFSVTRSIQKIMSVLSSIQASALLPIIGTNAIIYSIDRVPTGSDQFLATRHHDGTQDIGPVVTVDIVVLVPERNFKLT